VIDEEGQKMSKSKGNVIDPLVIIEKYGSDAFRFTLAAFAAQGRDIRFSTERVEGYRHFINKLWNAVRFISLSESKDSMPPTLASRWIESRLSATISEVNDSLREYRFNDSARAIYNFIWHEFCDWYIEAAKTEPSLETTKTLKEVLDSALRLLHPFMPFVTEELWQTISDRGGNSIMLAPYPTEGKRDLEAEEQFSLVMDSIIGIRNIRGELNIPPSFELRAYIKTPSERVTSILKENTRYIKKLARVGDLVIGTEVSKPKGSATAVKGRLEIYVLVEGIDIGKELKRLKKELTKTQESIALIEKKLLNEDFMKKAPPDVIEKERQKLSELSLKEEKLLEGIERLKEAEG
jgi:valyl-tRNA synthetase